MSRRIGLGNPARRQRGLTLIELMITLAISLGVLAAISYAYLGSRGAYRTNEGAARIQESARFALDSISRDLRGTGFIGCGSTQSATGAIPAPILTATGAAISYSTGIGVVSGFSGSGGWDLTAFTLGSALPAPANWVNTSDVLVIRTATSPPAIVADIDKTLKTMDVDGAVCGALIQPTASTPNPLTTFALSSCTRTLLVQVSNSQAPTCTPGKAQPGTKVALSFTAPGGMDTSPPSLTGDFLTMSRIDEVAYYVGTVPAPTGVAPATALYRWSSLTNRNEEVVDGIEQMGLQFGVASTLIDDTTQKTGDPARLNSSLLQLAGANPMGPNGVANPTQNWAKVLSVQVNLQVVGGDLANAQGVQGQAGATNLAANNAQFATALVPGIAGVATGDTRLRDRVAATVALRNRLN